jgi:hypothetical protein
MADVDFDPTLYLSTPRMSARDYLALGRLLLRYKPESLSPAGERAAERLAAEIATFTTELAARYKAKGLDEAELDFATDGLWYALRERLENWAVFERKAFVQLAEQQSEGEFDYRSRVVKAKRARALRRHLLAGIGINFTRKPYAEQVEFMVMIWQMIDHEGLADELAALIGSDFFWALRDCQRRYVEMVEAQVAAGHTSKYNLSDDRLRLRQALVQYQAAIIAMFDDRDADSVERVRRALSPIEMLREYNLRRAGGMALEGEERLDIDPLLAEQAAVNHALGIGDDAELSVLTA